MLAIQHQDMVAKLKRAHKMSISGPGVPDDATLYGEAAVHLEAILKDLEEVTEAVRDKSQDARKQDERASWGHLIPEQQLYPEAFYLLRTNNGYEHYGRLVGNRIYGRNHEGLLQPVPGQLWRHVETGEVYLVLAVTVNPTHAIIDVVRYYPTEEELSVGTDKHASQPEPGY